jgi:uncharacterized RDD family membrane protein YckC
MNWHYADKGKQVGPVSDEELQQLLQAGKINEATLVWSPGMPNWVPYRQAQAANPSAPAPEPLKLSGGVEIPANNLSDNPVWHYEDNGQQAGPVTEAELHRLLQTGKIDEASMVWRSGMPDWTPYGLLKASPNPTSAQPAPTPSPVSQPLKLSVSAESPASDLPDNLSWYYEDHGQQAGPVPTAALRRLLQTGKIDQTTLVWNSGMPNWLPYSQAGKTASPSANPPESTPSSPSGSHSPTEPEVVCAECGRMFPTSETIRYGKARVCAGCKPVFLQKLSEGASLGRRRPGHAGEMAYAGFWIRFAAKLLDGLILGVPLGIIMLVVLFGSIGMNQGRFEPSPFVTIMFWLLKLGFLFVNIMYQTFFLGKYGATPGKMICQLRVVTSNGDPISYGRAVGRAFSEILSGIICDIGYIIAGFDAEKRALHDHICSTRVIYK